MRRIPPKARKDSWKERLFTETGERIARTTKLRLRTCKEEGFREKKEGAERKRNISADLFKDGPKPVRKRYAKIKI